MHNVVSFTDEKLIQIRKKFESLDLENTGNLKREIVAEILMNEGTQLDRLMTVLLFEKFDADGDHMINLSEFIEFCKEMDHLSDVDILRQIFDFADLDGNKLLDLQEMKRIGQLMGLNIDDNDTRATIRALDRNSDNMIDFDEFCAILSF